ncbi:MAG: ABC transporter permease, partial [Eubacteriaceae bacterium]
VSAIISLVTIVQGVYGKMMNEFSALGAGKIMVQVKGTPLKQGLTDGDIEAISKIDYVSGVSPNLSISSTAVYKGNISEDILVQGRNEVYFKNHTDLLERGRIFNILDMTSKNRVCIINKVLAEQLFFGQDPLGKIILIGGTNFTVVGILSDKEPTSMTEYMFSNSNDTEGKILIPYKTAMSMAHMGSISALEVFISDSVKTDEVVENTKLVLNQAFNYKEDSFQIINLKSLIESMNTMTTLMTGVISGVASIALLVGGIGIMNMMLVSVTERKAEIGLRKALGAEPKQIQLQFLIESIFICLIGGFIGLVLGLIISFIGEKLLGLDYAFSVFAISLGVGFSVAVGVVFGWMPARRASKLNPIDALRSM